MLGEGGRLQAVNNVHILFTPVSFFSPNPTETERWLISILNGILITVGLGGRLSDHVTRSFLTCGISTQGYPPYPYPKPSSGAISTSPLRQGNNRCQMCNSKTFF